MDEILNSLTVGEILHITQKGTRYLYIRRSNEQGIVYSINEESKTLPLQTINAALVASSNGIQIDAQWYIEFNQNEYKARPCNLSVLKRLLARI